MYVKGIANNPYFLSINECITYLWSLEIVCYDSDVVTNSRQQTLDRECDGSGCSGQHGSCCSFREEAFKRNNKG